MRSTRRKITDGLISGLTAINSNELDTNQQSTEVFHQAIAIFLHQRRVLISAYLATNIDFPCPIHKI